MKRICQIVLWLTILLLAACLLVGCSRETPGSQIATDNAIDTVTAIQESLPAECKTNANELLFTVSKKEIREIGTHCEKEKEEIRRETLRWKAVSGLLMLVIIVYIVKRIVR